MLIYSLREKSFFRRHSIGRAFGNIYTRLAHPYIAYLLVLQRRTSAQSDWCRIYLLSPAATAPPALEWTSLRALAMSFSRSSMLRLLVRAHLHDTHENHSRFLAFHAVSSIKQRLDKAGFNCLQVNAPTGQANFQ